MSVDGIGNGNNVRYVPQSSQRVAYANQGAMINPNLNQVENDSFERSGGGGLGTTLTYAGLGGVGGGALGYFFNGNPITEAEGNLQVNEKFYHAYDNAILEGEITNAISKAELDAIKKAGVTSKEELDALRKLAAAENLEALPEEVKKALPKGVTTPDAASKLVQKAEGEMTKIDKAGIAKGIHEKTGSIKNLTDKIKNLTSVEEGLKALPDNVTKEELKKYISDNRELFGIKGEESKVTQEIEELSKLSKKELLEKVTNRKVNLQKIVDNANKNITKNINKETKALIEEAPEYLKKAFKEFKWSQAKSYGLWGAGLAAGAYFISSLFGGSKSKS